MNTLYPQNNASRMALDLGGIWDFRFRGDEGWKPIAVPASYNDQNPDPDYRNRAGTVEYPDGGACAYACALTRWLTAPGSC